jgi:hypothetical protein
MRRDSFRLHRAQQALFALFDTFAKAVLTCMPEPLPDVKAQAIARAKLRYDRLIKTAGRAMVGEARAAMQDLLENLEEEKDARPTANNGGLRPRETWCCMY